MLSYDQIAEIYDEDMGKNVSGEDIAFYVHKRLFWNWAVAPGE